MRRSKDDDEDDDAETHLLDHTSQPHTTGLSNTTTTTITTLTTRSAGRGQPQGGPKSAFAAFGAARSANASLTLSLLLPHQQQQQPSLALSSPQNNGMITRREIPHCSSFRERTLHSLRPPTLPLLRHIPPSPPPLPPSHTPSRTHTKRQR